MTARSFNRVARLYRWAEYLCFGRALERCRFHHLAAIGGCRSALVLGDGDGRFLERLLRQNSALCADVVDSSDAMLALLERRVAPLVRQGRAYLHHADAASFQPPGDYDLIATHFFLDCFSDEELQALVPRIAGSARPGSVWLVSEFQIPSSPIAGTSARVLVRFLYLAFRILTGLRPTHLPDHGAALGSAGFHRIRRHNSLGGLLVSELWRKI